MITNRADIRRLQFNTPYPEIVISGQNSAVGLDFDFDARNMYWSDIVNSTIKRAQVEGDSVTVVISKGLNTPEDIAVDWINKKLYWTDSGTKRIEVADLNGGHRLSLVQSGLQKPRAIVVHPLVG